MRCPDCGADHPGFASGRCTPCVKWLTATKAAYGRHVGGVYFVRSGDYIKIGVSSNVIIRVAQSIYAWNPHQATPLGWIPEPEMALQPRLEREIHDKFAHCRHRSEWFVATPELLAFIEHNAEPWPFRTSQ